MSCWGAWTIREIGMTMRAVQHISRMLNNITIFTSPYANSNIHIHMSLWRNGNVSCGHKNSFRLSIIFFSLFSVFLFLFLAITWKFTFGFLLSIARSLARSSFQESEKSFFFFRHKGGYKWGPSYNPSITYNINRCFLRKQVFLSIFIFILFLNMWKKVFLFYVLIFFLFLFRMLVSEWRMLWIMLMLNSYIV